MKAIKLSAIIFAILFIAMVCTTASAEMPAKYNLDNQLQKVDSIYKYKFMGWDKVDNQSLVVQTSPADYYLIVLSSPSTKLLFSESIRIDSKDNMVRPGYNNVIVRGSGFTEDLIINKIYKFKDSKQVKEIEAQLTAEKK